MSAELPATGANVTAIESAAIEAIRRHGVDTFPDECCGALIAVGGRIVEAFALPNTTSSGAARRFRIGPDSYREAERRAHALGGTLVGFYHSHPNEPARPSAYDLEHAWPNLVYVIISIVQGAPRDITAWHLRDDRSGFDEGELKWPTGS
ncbi:MAG TPA: M67 family metallopeptidase [Vicinamibacterales bacterium]|nr:M67 family metallopeptidase [Vicinamibacterales bacterium]